MDTSRLAKCPYAGCVSDSSASVPPDEVATAPSAEMAHGASSALSSVLQVLTTTEALLGDTEVALARLEAGTYSTCELCGGPIAPEILASSPLARRCGAHAS